jgi:hypothetical protein
MKKLLSIACAAAVLMLPSMASSQNVRLVPSKPSHLFYTPTAYVTKPFTLVASLHEISYSFPGRFELHASLLDNIGRINFGGKYGILDNLSVGAGLAYSLGHMGVGVHGIPNNAHPRFGTYLAIGLLQTPTIELAITPHTQIGDRISAGADFGIMGTPTEWVSIIGEVGTSFDFHDDYFYLNFDGGVRIHPPKIPYLQFDAGIDIEEFPVGHDGPTVAPYLDVIFCIKTNN